MIRLLAVALLATLTLASCSTTPGASGQKSSRSGGGGYLAGDGPGSDDPARLAATPDAVPRAEALHPYANRPYEALGVRYTPLTHLGNYRERGVASWYGKKFHGQRTSSGEDYNMYGMTAAHKTLPIPSYARVTNLQNGKSVVVRVNDRGPFMHGRIIDVSYAAASKLGIVGNGSAEVEVESIVPGKAGHAATSAHVPPPSIPEPVRVEPLPVESEPASPSSSAGAEAYLQLGSFQSPQGAESFLARMKNELGDTGKEVILYPKGRLFCVHIGPYRSAEEARTAAPGLQSRLGFRPFLTMH